MANSDKNIKITPNISASGQPNIVYTGSGNVPIALKVLDDSYGTLSFEGSAGQLFSLNNNLSSGTIFSVNDISGMPQFDVNADGTIRVAPYGSGVYMGGVGGGTFTIQPSVKSSSGAGTSVAITAGNGVTSGAGGSLILQAGIQATTGGDGKVVVKQVAGQTSNIFEVQNSSGTIYESTYIASSVVYKDISTNGSSAPLARLYAGSSEAALFLNGSGRTIKLTANNDVPNLTFTGFGQNVTFYNGSSGTTSFLIANASTGVVSFPAGAVFDSSSGTKFGHSSSGQTLPYNYSTVVGSNDINSGNLYVNALGGGANGIQVGHNAELFWVREGGKPRVFVQSIGSSGSKNGFVGVRTESPLGQLHVVAGMNNKPVMITQAKTTNTVTVTNKQLTSNVATLTYTGTGAFKNGETITVTGVDATFNGTFTVTSATTTTVTYALVSTDVGSTASSGTITCTQTANLQEWQNSSGSTLASVGSAGAIYARDGIGSSTDISIASQSYPTVGFVIQGDRVNASIAGTLSCQMLAGRLNVNNTLTFSSTTLQSSTAHILEQRSGTNAQVFQLYNTYTDASNYERLGITWASNICTIGLAQAGTGSVRSLVIAGANATSGAGGDVTITAGNASSTGAGGNLILQAGLQATSGGDGKVVVRQKSGQTSNLQEWQNSSSGILTSIGPSGAINLLPYGTSSGNTNEIRFNELAANGTDYVGFKAPDSISTPKIWTLPSGDGATGQALITNGSGLLSWGTIANLSSYTNTSAATTSAYDLGTSNFVKANPSTSGLTINGFSSSGSYDGRMLKLVNVSNYNINIINTGTTVCVGGNNIVLGPKDGADLILDSGASVWRVF